MDIIGKMFENRYEILEKIGVGGMATVYRAKCHLLNREVAIKVLKDEFTTDSEFIRRFNSEAQAAASLVHPNIVSVYDVGVEDNLYYIVMELVKGKTLKKIIEEVKRLDWKVALHIAKQVVSALSLAHKNGIIHRDIKPHNIIITKEGIAKVTDFGIAKISNNATMTVCNNDTIGSVHYFSPEHAKGGITDQKSDLYSLGIVIYEMITGKLPFEADTPVSVALKQVQENPVEPIEIVDIPKSVNSLIMRAMQKDRNLRYQSAEEMMRDIDLILKNPDVDLDAARVNLNIKDKIIKDKDENSEDKKMKTWQKAILIVLSSIIFLIILSLSLVFLTKLVKGKQVFIPNLVVNENNARMSADEAKEIAKKLGFNIEVIEINDDDIEKGKVVRQDPKYQPNYMVKVGRNIKLYVSKGPELIELPEDLIFVKMPVEDVKKKMDELKVPYELIEENNEEIEKDKVIKIEVKRVENNKIKKNEKVKIYVSKGSKFKEIDMPNFIQKTIEDARKLAKEHQFKVEEVEISIDYMTNNIVTEQEPKAGEKVKEGQKITLYVNKVREIKKGELKINVDKLTTELGIKDKEKKVKVKVLVDDKKVEEREVKASEKEFIVAISSLGRSRVNIYIGETLKFDDYIDLNQKKEWIIK